jgi:DNA primase
VSAVTDDVERVRRALPRLDHYIQSRANDTADLSSEGGELRGANPWHGSSTGNNFAVDPDEGQWFCHSQSCKAGGGILEYIAVDEDLVECGKTGDISSVFPEVLEIAAETAGVDLDMGAQDRAQVKERREERERLDDLYEAAAAFYHQHLDVAVPHPNGDDALSVREWMREFYGLGDDILASAMVGFAPNNDTALLDALDAGGTDLLKSGLVVDTADGIVDFFDGRIVFPYFERGTPRYFIGRKTPLTPDHDWEQGKYKKLPTAENKTLVSELVDEPIFGRDDARSADTVVVTEGVTDVLAAQQHGYAAIAPVTTTFKNERMRDVAQLVRGKRVVVIMDEDAESGAGLDGALKTIDAIAKRTGPATEVQVARLPLDDGDLCDYLRENGGLPGDLP